MFCMSVYDALLILDIQDHFLWFWFLLSFTKQQVLN